MNENPGTSSAPVALLIIDMLNLFDFEGGAALCASATRCAPVIARLRSRFDDVGAPVIYVNDNFAQWQGDFRDLVALCAAADGPSAVIARRLLPLSGHYHVLKPKHSAFVGTPLRFLLDSLGVRRLVLSGIAADSCILATANDANMREFDLWVPGDAVAAISKGRKANALALIKTSLRADIRGTRAVPALFPDRAGRRQ